MTFSKTNSGLMSNSVESQKFWGKQIEDSLPKPTITEDPKDLVPSSLLIDILQYARGAESRGEFLFRTKYLHPIFEHYSSLNEDIEWTEDDMGNMYVVVGKDSPVLHVGHIDTVHSNSHSPKQEIDISKEGIASLREVVKHSLPKQATSVRWINGERFDHHYIDYDLPPKQTRCLGADDGCAVAVMIFLIAHQVPGTYLFTRGEEIGCVGTHYIIDNELLDWSKYMMAIEVDRKGTNEIIGNMSVGNTASQSFVSSLSEQLGMGHKLGKGTITDVGHIAKHVPECVNISAGYNLQHSDRETTDLHYLDNLAAAMLKVDWDELTIERKAGAFHAPVAKRVGSGLGYNGNYSGNYSGGYTGGYASKNNTYGDYAPEPSTLTNKLFSGMQNNSFSREAWVRSNAGFVTEFLMSLQISPAEMDAIIMGEILVDEVEEDEEELNSTEN